MIRLNCVNGSRLQSIGKQFNNLIFQRKICCHQFTGMNRFIALPITTIAARFAHNDGKGSAIPRVHNGVDGDLDPACCDQQIGISVAAAGIVIAGVLQAIPGRPFCLTDPGKGGGVNVGNDAA